MKSEKDKKKTDKGMWRCKAICPKLKHRFYFIDQFGRRVSSC